MNASVLDHDVKRYVDAVAAALVDLPDATRAEILEDLAAHLAEFDLEQGSLDAQLGDPAAYAAELRASAGLVAPSKERARGGADPLAHAVASARGAYSRVRSTTWWRELAELRPELRPAWWVLRAWLVLRLLNGPARLNVPLPRLVDGLNGPLGFVMRVAVLIAAVILSVRLGRAELTGRRRGFGLALTLVGVISALSFFAQIDDPAYTVSYQSGPYNAGSLVDENGRRLQSVMVFDDGGRLLDQRYPALVDADGTVIAAQGDGLMINGRVRNLAPCTGDKTWALCTVPDTGVPGATGAGGALRGNPTGATGANGTSTTVLSPTTVPTPLASTTTAPVPLAPTTSVG